MMAFFPANFMLQSPSENGGHESPSSLSSILTPCNPQHFQGMAAMLGKRSVSFSGLDACQEEANDGGEDENLSDDGSQVGEKKRRLNMEQVKTLERNFELGNKLEPERKMQLAKALGLQPRQVAIWFQNRRARWKTKQLEKDYEVLKRQFDALKADNQSLHSQNQKLQAEISALRGKEPTESINLNKETDQGSCSNRSDNSNSDIKLDISTPTTTTTTTTTSIAFFPSSSSSSAMNAPSQLFQSSRPHLHAQKLHHPPVKEASFTNMFCSIDDQPGFWPWIDHHNFN